MGHHAGRQALKILEHVEQVLAIELLLGAQAVELRAPLCPGPLVADLVADIRKRVTFMSEDRYLAPDLAAMREYVRHELALDDIAPGVV